MNVIVDTSHELMSHSAAEIVARTIREKPDASILVATGNTPIRTYELLAEMVGAGGIDTSTIGAVQLDDYIGVTDDDPRSLYAWMMRAFIQPLGISPANIIRFDNTLDDPDEAVEEYDRSVGKLDGLDLAILGLGPNGHLGFNEPPSPADAPTRIIELTAASLASNAGYWDSGELVPERAFTAGMTTILSARHILLLVSGVRKHEILRQTVTGPITPDVPASLLQTVSEKVTVAADDAAWGALERK